MKFCYNTNSTLPKQCQSSRSVLKDESRTFGLFWKEKHPSFVIKSPKHLWSIHVRRAKLVNGSFHISQMELPHAGSFLDLELCTATVCVPVSRCSSSDEGSYANT